MKRHYWLLFFTGLLICSRSSAADDEQKTALPLLRDIIFESQPPREGNGERPPLSGTLRTLARSHALRNLITPYLGHPLTFAQMKTLKGEIGIFFRLHNRAFLSVSVPPQTVKNGVLHMALLEYRLGEITVHGSRWAPDWTIRRDSGLVRGQTLNLLTLQTDLNWINQNPFHTVDMIYHPSQKNGYTDVDLHVADRFPVYGYAALSNQGDPTTGRLNWYVGTSWGNAFNLGQILTYQFNRADSGRSNNHAASWTIPLPHRSSLQIYGSYSETNPVPSNPNEKDNGESGQASIRWQHMIDHITLGKDLGLDGTIQLGFDWKTTNSDSYKPYMPIEERHAYVSNADTDQFVVGYDGSVQDPWGQTKVNNQFYYGPGGLTHYDNKKSYRLIFEGSSPNYVYDRLSLTRSFTLPLKLSTTTKVTFQRASKNLLYSEQLSSGGMSNARGYFVNSSFGSNANAFSEELFLPSFSIAKLAHIPALEDTQKLGFFWDWVDNRQVTRTTDGPRAATLSSVGIDVNSTVNRYLSITYDVGWRLRRIHTTAFAEHRSAFCDFQVIAGF
ncbi:ShlB/FhaC/HecB family hemolysin secretion/activation protein [Acetobacteraceae bacterium ESL0709]|nr:ShlB/FhaC/HecB family hemolysin secretion/activation protein [Acetobacteraceae bacterium ESL0697]MDF7677553.1 ShlB/FhaC/HecB family hemolysin secretion/activation protein [Acetobacteraceae bacterium ESL0709]